MSASPRWVVPEVDGSRYRWRFGDARFEVDAARGARVTSFALGSDDILTGPEVNALNHGSTFWTSPQADWGWPPVVAIDAAPYTTQGAGAEIRFESSVSEAFPIAVGKQFRVDGGRGEVVIEYALQNRGAGPRSLAAWEISRVPTGGLTFFPAGAGIDPRSNLVVREAGGFIWFAYDPVAITDHQKLFAHGREGWLGHVDVARRLLLVKSFEAIAAADQAPGEAHIEIYADPAHSYVELEQQGRTHTLAPGARSSWTVRWRLLRLPPELAARAGNPDLPAFVRALAR